MRIFLTCPAPPRSLRGNRVTAVRWARILRQLGHRVTIGSDWRGEACDVLLALHARKSYSAAAAYRRARPQGPLLVCLTGTDLYHDLPRSRHARQALTWADRIVVLQANALEELTTPWRRKAIVIHQSAPAPTRNVLKSRRHFDVCVLGHFRAEKDPWRAALALRHLPTTSRIRVTQAGRALAPSWAERAQQLMAREPRYRWLGEIARPRARRLLARSHAMVISSRLEGGANVVSEAIVAGVPVLASAIPGNMGLLGATYPGYFAVGDTQALARLMHRAETDAGFYQSMLRGVQQQSALFVPELEAKAWQTLLNEIVRRKQP